MMDWGRNEEFPHTPVTNREFSKKRERLVRHFVEEYIGSHMSEFDGWQGRFFSSVLPSFAANLSFAN